VAVSLCIGRTNDGLNLKLHEVCDETGRPVHRLLTAGHTSDDTGARGLLPSLSQAKQLIADRGYGAD
jgi:transposase